MSCPDWRELLAERQRRGAAEPAGWDSAIAHLDDCAECRRLAERLDPSLLFRRLPVLAIDAGEVDEMRRRVAALRRARQVEGGSPSRRRRWTDAAAAALLTGSLLGVLHGPRAADGASVEAAHAQLQVDRLHAELSGLPVLEHFDQPFEQVVQWSSDELSMIVLVDERFDV